MDDDAYEMCKWYVKNIRERRGKSLKPTISAEH